MARQWHPDKNPDNPQAEQKFKAISEAYEVRTTCGPSLRSFALACSRECTGSRRTEDASPPSFPSLVPPPCQQVLSDTQKRQIYNERGKDGVQQAQAAGNVDIAMVFRLMFGGGAFDDIFGDICQLPMLKQMISSMEGQFKGEAMDEDRILNPARQEQLKREEDVYCKQLSIKLMARLDLKEKDGDKAFGDLLRKDAKELCEAPGGVELLAMIGYVYGQEGKQYAGR